MLCIYNEYISHLMYYWNIYIETLPNDKNMSNLIWYNITKFVQQLMFMIKCLNGFVIKWTDKINCHIINHGDDYCLSKQCGFNGLLNKFNRNSWFYSIWYVMYVTSLLIVRVSTLAFKLIWFSFWEILSCKMLWYINTIHVSVCQTDTVIYVNVMHFTSTLKVIPPFCYFDLYY